MEVVRQEPRFFARLKVTDDGRPVCSLNTGGPTPDLLLQRPVVHPLYTPAGYPVTEMGAHNFRHHKGVWMGHAAINGVNCFHDRPETGWIVPVHDEVHAAADGVTIVLENEWRDRSGTVIATESRRHAVARRSGGYVLDIRSELRASHGPLTLGREIHAYAGCRVLDALDEDDGGRVRDSAGRAGPEAVTGELGNWLDCTGTIGSHVCGVSLIAHPRHSPMPLFARHYGTMLLNPSYHDDLTVAAGESLKIGVRVFAHDGEASDDSIHSLWEDFGAQDV